MSESNTVWKRYEAAKGNWENWRSLYDEAYAFAIPNRNPYWNSGEPGSKPPVEGRRKNPQVYDITAVIATRRLAARLQKNLTPPDEQWFQLEASDVIEDDNKRKEINEFLDLYTDIIFKQLANSNFQTAMSEFYPDLCIGTAFMMALEGTMPDKPLMFKASSPDAVFPEETVFEEIKTHYRRFTDVTEDDIRDMWPDAELTDSMRDKIRQDSQATFNVVECVMWQPENENWRIVLFHEESRAHLLDKETASSAWISARWDKAPMEIGGRGAVIQALPTIRSLNKLVEHVLRHVELASSPPWMATTDGIFNPHDFKIEPNKVIPVNPTAFAQVPFKRIDVNTPMDVTALEVNDLRSQVKEALYDMPIRPVESPPQTATEIMIRQQNFLEDIQPAFARLSYEFLPNLINRVIYILQRKGYLPPDLKVDGKAIVIRYKSPLVRGADIQKVQNLQMYSQIMDEMVGQQVKMGSLNIADLGQYLAEKLDASDGMVKSAGEFQNFMDQLMKAAQPADPVQQSPGANNAMSSQIDAAQLNRGQPQQ